MFSNNISSLTDSYRDNLAHIKESDYDAEKSFSVIKNVTRLIKEAFPDVPLMPSIGNHDSWPAGSIPAPAVAPDTDYYLKLQKIAGWNVQNGILQQDNVGSFNKGKTSFGMSLGFSSVFIDSEKLLHVYMIYNVADCLFLNFQNVVLVLHDTAHFHY